MHVFQRAVRGSAVLGGGRRDGTLAEDPQTEAGRHRPSPPRQRRPLAHPRGQDPVGNLEI